jgi:hypothetical protein
VKCYSLIAFILVSFSAFADSYLVMPTNKVTAEVGVGDIVEVEVINQDNEKLNIKSNRLGNVFYILENIEENKFRVVVSPKTSADKKITDDLDKFEYRGFKFSKDLNNLTNDYIVKDINIEIETNQKSWAWILLIIILLAIIIHFAPSFIKKYKDKIEVRRKKRFLINKIVKIKTRNDIEEVYRYKNELKTLFNISNETYKEIVNEINKIQYKKTWSDTDKSLANKVIKKLKGEVNGI